MVFLEHILEELVGEVQDATSSVQAQRRPGRTPSGNTGTASTAPVPPDA
jgi:Mg2+/Co2+ transporter CorB